VDSASHNGDFQSSRLCESAESSGHRIIRHPLPLRGQSMSLTDTYETMTESSHLQAWGQGEQDMEGPDRLSFFSKKRFSSNTRGSM
jgi:hypothetical protein